MTLHSSLTPVRFWAINGVEEKIHPNGDLMILKKNAKMPNAEGLRADIKMGVDFR